MAEPNQPIYLASKRQLQKYAQRSADTRRSAELTRAWIDRKKLIKRRAKGEWVSDLAKEYGIGSRQMYRVVDTRNG